MIERFGQFIIEVEKSMSNRLSQLEQRKRRLVTNIQISKHYLKESEQDLQYANYYAQAIRKYSYQLAVCEREIKSERGRQLRTPIALSLIVLILLVGAFVTPQLTGYFTADLTNETIENVTTPVNLTNITIPENITNITVENLTIENITIEQPIVENITIENITNITEIVVPENITIENITNITAVNATVISDETLQYSATILEPVRWKKTITLDKESESLTVEIPADAVLVNVAEIEDGEEKQIADGKITEIIDDEEGIVDIPETEEDVHIIEQELEIEPDEVEQEPEDEPVEITIDVPIVDEEVVIVDESNLWVKAGKSLTRGRLTGKATAESEFNIWDWLTGITGFAASEPKSANKEIRIDHPVKQVELEYLTEAPQVTEEQISTLVKRVTVSSETHYTDILTYTSIPELTANSGQIKLYRITNDSRELVTDVVYKDVDGNSLIDRIEWITPALSSETYEIVIEITDASHLDENREFLSDIFAEVYQLDDIWSEPIYDNEYVRVTFEQPLDSTRDITVYPRIISGEPTIEVYEQDETELLATFDPVTSNEYNKIYLTNLTGEQDTFDLRIIGGTVEFDHIIDPTAELWEDCVDYSEWTITPAATWLGDPCKASNGADEIMELTTGFDLTGDTSANLSFEYDHKSLEAGTDYLKVHVSNDSTNWYQVIFHDGDNDPGTENISLGDHILFTNDVKVRFTCSSGPGEECTIDNINVTSWVTLLADGEACTYGDQCISDLCISGFCRAAGDCSQYSGAGCSEDTTLWDNTAAGTCLTDTTCDTTDPVRMDCGVTCETTTDPTYDTCDTANGDSCDIDAGSGNFSQTGLCADDGGPTCVTTDFVVYYTDIYQISTDCDGCSEGDICDETLTDGDFTQIGTDAYDPDDGVCDECTAPPLGEDGDCEEACAGYTGSTWCDETANTGVNNDSGTGWTCCSNTCAADEIFNADGTKFNMCEYYSSTGSNDWCLEDDSDFCYSATGDSCDATNGWGIGGAPDSFAKVQCLNAGTDDAAGGCWYDNGGGPDRSNDCTENGCTGMTTGDCSAGTSSCSDDGVGSGFVCYYDEACGTTSYTAPTEAGCGNIDCTTDGEINTTANACYWNEACGASGWTGSTQGIATCDSGTFVEASADCFISATKECHYDADDTCGGDGLTNSTEDIDLGYEQSSITDGAASFRFDYENDQCQTSADPCTTTGTGFTGAVDNCQVAGTVYSSQCQYDSSNGDADRSNDCTTGGCVITGEAEPFACDSGSWADGAGWCYNDGNNACYHDTTDMCAADADGWDYATDNCYNQGSTTGDGTSGARCYWTEGCDNDGALSSCADGQLVTDAVTCDNYDGWADGAGSCNNSVTDTCYHDGTDLCADDADGWDFTTVTCDSYDDTTAGDDSLTESEINDSASCTGACVDAACCDVQTATCDQYTECKGVFGNITNEEENINNTCHYTNAGAYEWNTTTLPAETACEDGYDNDCDGLIDDADTEDCGANAPEVWNITGPIALYTITEAGPGSSGTMEMQINFTACDAEGVSDLSDNSIAVRVNVTNAEFRDNDTTSCKWIEDDEDGDCAHYSCNVTIWYYDSAGDWTMNASITDASGTRSYNLSNTTELDETIAMKINVTGLTWDEVLIGQTDKLANNDPLGINNTGNKDITAGNVKVTAYDLIGINPIYWIGASNFTVNTADACEGTPMDTSSQTAVAGATVDAGDLDSGTMVAKENLFFCLEQVPPLLISQAYSTTTDWIIEVT